VLPCILPGHAIGADGDHSYGERTTMPTTDARSTKTILIIDDDPDFIATVRTVLEGAGYGVIEAHTGADGLEKVRDGEPDLVVLDVMMESSTAGYGVNELLKHSGEFDTLSQIPVIMVSSIQESPDDLFPRAPEAEMIRPDRYLTKPLDIPRFLEVVRRTLRT
jgi:two-component system alkaline phosphatase synthesis response regulator PhoP